MSQEQKQLFCGHTHGLGSQTVVYRNNELLYSALSTSGSYFTIFERLYPSQSRPSI